MGAPSCRQKGRGMQGDEREENMYNFSRGEHILGGVNIVGGVNILGGVHILGCEYILWRCTHT